MNPFSALSLNLDESFSLVQKYQQHHPNQNSQIGTQTEMLRAEIQQRIDHQILQVMLYGAYNAGKSTLVNVLLGKEVAKVNDIPTTDKIDQYDWDGIHLLDTPGVNAPIEHEQATDEQVKRTGAMLFVIREGDQDAKDVYARLFDMLKRGKKIFIVLNHQLTNQDDLIRAQSRINQILTSLAQGYGVELEAVAQISVYPVNLKTAYNGRLKQQEKLIEHSGYTHFIEGFKQWVKLQDNEGRYLETLKAQISEQWYNPAITSFESAVSTNDHQQVKALRDDRLMLEIEQRSLKADAVRKITQEINLLKNNVSEALTGSKDQAELDTKLTMVFSELPAKLETWLGDEFGKVGRKLSVVVNYEHSQPEHSSSTSQYTDALVDSAKTFLTDKESLKQTLLIGRALKIPMLKGRWASTLVKWAGKAAIVMQAAMFLYDLHKANRDQNKENEQEKNLSLKLYQIVEEISSSVISDMTKSVHEIIDNAFAEQIKDIQHQIDALETEDGEIKNDLTQLIHLKNQMLAIGW